MEYSRGSDRLGQTETQALESLAESDDAASLTGAIVDVTHHELDASARGR